MNWTVKFTNKAAKQSRKLPESVQDNLKLLIKFIEVIYAGTHEKAPY